MKRNRNTLGAVAAMLLAGALAGCSGFWDALPSSSSSSSSSTDAYTLTSVGTVAAGKQTKSIAIDGTGTYLLAVNSGGSPDLSAFTFDSSTTGKLDADLTAATGSGTTGAFAIVTAPSSSAFYVLNQTTNQLAGFTIASGATSPTAISGSPWTLLSTPLAIAIGPSGNYLYVSTALGIYYFTINSDGSVSAGNGGSLISSDPAYSMQVDPTGQWLIEGASGTGYISAIPINSAGAPTSAATQTVNLPSTNLTQMAVSPSGSSSPYVFVAMGTGGTAIVPFTASSTDPFGTVYTVSVKNSNGGDNAVAVDPENRLLYVGETTALSGTQSGGLRVFTIGSGGSVSELSSSPFATGGTGPSSIVATSTAVYVSNSAVGGSSNGNITGYTVAASSSD